MPCLLQLFVQGLVRKQIVSQTMRCTLLDLVADAIWLDTSKNCLACDRLISHVSSSSSALLRQKFVALSGLYANHLMLSVKKGTSSTNPNHFRLFGIDRKKSRSVCIRNGSQAAFLILHPAAANLFVI
jgi:hypothetical protein